MQNIKDEKLEKLINGVVGDEVKERVEKHKKKEIDSKKKDKFNQLVQDALKKEIDYQ
jgi:hypothetical protein